MVAGESLAALLGDTRSLSGDGALIPRTPDQWSAVVDASLRHGLAPLLFRRLQSLGSAAVADAASVERLHVAYCHNALRQRTMREELRRILRGLRHDGIRVVLLKGAHLADVVYGDPALRPMVDIDLLVTPSDLARAERSLIAAGYDATSHSAVGTDYATHQHLHPFEKEGALPIEVHRGIAPADAPFDVDLDGLWHRARRARVAGTAALVLSPEDLVEQLCLHVSYIHRFDASLLSVYDVGAVISHHRTELDWHRLAAACNRNGTGRFVHGTLSLVRALFGTEVPPRALDELDHAAGDQAVVAAARDWILTSPEVELPVAYRTLRESDGLVPAMGAFARAIWPSPERMRAIYHLAPHSAAVYAYYVVRPFDLVRRRGKVVAALLARTPSLRSTLAREERRRTIDHWIDGGGGLTGMRTGTAS